MLGAVLVLGQNRGFVWVFIFLVYYLFLVTGCGMKQGKREKNKKSDDA